MATTNYWSDRIMSEVEAVYVAGFFDGEGSIYGIKAKDKPTRRTGYSIVVKSSIGQCHLGVLEHVRAVTGNGRIIGEKKQQEHHKERWRLTWTSNQIRHIFPQLVDYLIVKRAVVEKALTLLQLKDGYNNYGKNNMEQQVVLYNEMSALNKRGIQVAHIDFEPPREVRNHVPHVRKKPRPPVPTCSFDECAEKHYAKGYCFRHYRKAFPEIYKTKWVPVGIRGKRICPTCNLEFEYYRKTPKFCSVICRRKAGYAAWKQRQ